MLFTLARYTFLREPFRSFAYAPRDSAYTLSCRASMQMLFRFENSYRDSAVDHRRLVIFLSAKILHPPLERAPVETSFFLDLTVMNRRPAQDPPNRSGLVCLA